MSARTQWIDADEEEATGDLLEVVGEVFAAHGRPRHGEVTLRPDDLLGDTRHVIRHRGIVHRRRITFMPCETQLAIIRGGDAGAAAMNRFGDALAAIRRECSSRAFDERFVGDHIGGRACANRSNRDDG